MKENLNDFTIWLHLHFNVHSAYWEKSRSKNKKQKSIIIEGWYHNTGAFNKLCPSKLADQKLNLKKYWTVDEAYALYLRCVQNYNNN